MSDPTDGWPADDWPSEDWPADDQPTGRGRHGRPKGSGRQRSLLVRYRWYGALLAGVAAAALATGAIILMNSSDGRLVANGCGMVSCAAALPGSTSTSAAPQGSPRGKLTDRRAPAHHRVTAAPAHSPSASSSVKAPATRSPSPTPTASVSPTPTASVSPTPTASVSPTPTASVSPTPTASVSPTPT